MIIPNNFGTLLYCKDEVIQLNHTDKIITSYKVKKQYVRRLSKVNYPKLSLHLPNPPHNVDLSPPFYHPHLA